MTPGGAARALAELKLDETLAQVLDTQAAALAERVRDSLGTGAGGEHATPWRQTGALQSSVGHVADGLAAAVGSSDPAAAPQEMGTARLPPRPFLAPAAALAGEAIARAAGRAVADVLKQRLS